MPAIQSIVVINGRSYVSNDIRLVSDRPVDVIPLLRLDGEIKHIQLADLHARVRSNLAPK